MNKEGNQLSCAHPWVWDTVTDDIRMSSTSMPYDLRLGDYNGTSSKTRFPSGLRDRKSWLSNCFQVYLPVNDSVQAAAQACALLTCLDLI